MLLFAREFSPFKAAHAIIAAAARRTRTSNRRENRAGCHDKRRENRGGDQTGRYRSPLVALNGENSRAKSRMSVKIAALRRWVRQAERDAGQRPGLTTSEREELKPLQREYFELKRANEILRKASAFSPRRSSTAERSDAPANEGVQTELNA
jgi:transposase-like protein